MGTLRNSVHLIGRPGADPEIKKFGERKSARFTLATNEKHYNDKNELVTEMDEFMLIDRMSNEEEQKNEAE